MNVVVVETWNRRLAAQVHHAGTGSGQAPNLIVRSHGGDSAVRHRQRLHHIGPVVEGDDLAVDEDHVLGTGWKWESAQDDAEYDRGPEGEERPAHEVLQQALRSYYGAGTQKASRGEQRTGSGPPRNSAAIFRATVLAPSGEAPTCTVRGFPEAL